MESGLRVLIVDNQASMRGLVRKMFHQMGLFQVVEEAGDGEEAWDKLSTQTFDLVISDVKMPRMDGIELLKRCRQEIHLREIPFLMISGDAMPEVVASAGEWGAYDYIVKPFSFTTLKSRVVSIFKRLKDPKETFFREIERLKENGLSREALQKLAVIESIEAFNKAKWWNLRAECHMELGEYETASEYLDKALALSEDYLAAIKNVAIVQQELGNEERVIEALDRADSISPLDVDRKLNLGKLLLQTGKEEDGKKLLQRAMKQVDPRNKQSYSLKVAEVYMENGQFAEAEEIYVKAIRENPAQIEAFNRLGIALRRQGKWQEAENYYQLALKHYPANAAIYYNLGVLYLNRDEKKKASQYFWKAIELQPDFKEARDMLKLVE